MVPLWNTLLRLESMGKTLRSTYTDAINEYPFIQQTHLYLTQLWKCFEHSAKRTALYLKVQEETKKIQLTEQAKKIVGKKLKKACTTRWLSFDHSIEAVHADIISITLLRLESMGKTLRSTYTDAINEYPFILCKSPKAAVSFSPRILSVFKIEIMSA
jgi:hypothetical protein